MRKRFFITATGTGVGKTFITQSLIRQAKRHDLRAMAYKPVISGFDPDDALKSDTVAIIESLGMKSSSALIDEVSPWRFKAPLAPSMAARLEGMPINFDKLISYSKKMLAGSDDVIVIEGVGGLMVPIDDTHLVVDWMQEIATPILLVTGTYLGSLSHTLSAYAVLHQRGMTPTSIVVNETEQSSVSLESTIDELARWVDVPLLRVPFQTGSPNWHHESLNPLFE